MKQQWYVEEQIAPVRSVSHTTLVATQAAPTATNSLLSSMTEAELEAIAEEAGVTVEFVRQSLAQSNAGAQVQQTSTATTAFAKSDYYQVSLRVRKPTRLSRRRILKVVALPAATALILGIILGLTILPNIGSSNISPQLLNIISVACFSVLLLLFGVRSEGKRLGIVAGGVFGFTSILTIGVMASLHDNFSFSFWRFLIPVVLPVSILYGTIGGGLGLLGALIRTGVSRVRRRRRERLQSRITS